jgi:hypothetical protein
MVGSRRFTAMIYREGDGYVSFCPELDVASQARVPRLMKPGRGHLGFMAR